MASPVPQAVLKLRAGVPVAPTWVEIVAAVALPGTGRLVRRGARNRRGVRRPIGDADWTWVNVSITGKELVWCRWALSAKKQNKSPRTRERQHDTRCLLEYLYQVTHLIFRVYESKRRGPHVSKRGMRACVSYRVRPLF